MTRLVTRPSPTVSPCTKRKKKTVTNLCQLQIFDFSRFLAPCCAPDTATMPGEAPVTPGAPRGPRLPKKRTIDLSVSPAKTKRGPPPKKKLKQQSLLLMRQRS